MTFKNLSAATLLSAAALATTAASAGAYGADLPKGWDSGTQVGKSTYADNPCKLTYRFGRNGSGYLWTWGRVGNPACKVSIGLFGEGPFNGAIATNVWLSGTAKPGVKASLSNVPSWSFSLGAPYNFGNNVYLKITTSIPYYGVSSGEIHDRYNR